MNLMGCPNVWGKKATELLRCETNCVSNCKSEVGESWKSSPRSSACRVYENFCIITFAVYKKHRNLFLRNETFGSKTVENINTAAEKPADA